MAYVISTLKNIMKNNCGVFGFLGGTFGVGIYLSSTDLSLVMVVAWACYWGFLFGLIAKVVESVLFKNQILSKLGSYFQSWGAVGTFVGLIIMTGEIGSSLEGGATDSIKEQLAGFSICFLTSLIGVVLAIIASMISDAMALDSLEK